MFLQKFVFKVLVFFCCFESFAQKKNLLIKVVDKNEKGVIGATIILQNLTNARVKISNFTDTTGMVSFKVDEKDHFLISATSIGYKKIEKEISATENSLLIQLADDAKTLGSVVIIAKKPLITQEDDKTIVDPEPLAQTSTSALELLEKTPGLFVDQDGNVYLNSTSPASIYINGREQKMSASDIASVLKSLPPNGIEKIEIIRTPSANMDASSSGGSVNIMLKKGIKLGRTGSFNGGFSQGKLGNQFAGINLNKSKDKRSTFININFSRRDNFEESNFTRIVPSETSSVTQLQTETNSKLPGFGFFTSLGVNFDFSKKFEVGYDARINLSNSNTSTNNKSLVFKEKETSQKLSENENAVENITKSYSISQGAFAKYKFDEKGSELKVDLSFNFTKNDGNQNYSTQFTIPRSILSGGFGNWNNTRNLLAVQSDFKYYFPKKITFESGIKVSILHFDNATAYFKDGKAKDDFRTNSFAYFENINAAYVQGSKTFGAFILKIGSRLENTVMRGKQIIPSDTTFAINRTDLFPYVYFSRKLFSRPLKTHNIFIISNLI